MLGGLGATVVGVGGVVTTVGLYKHYKWHLHYYQFKRNNLTINVCIARNKSQSDVKVIQINAGAYHANENPEWGEINRDFCRRYRHRNTEKTGLEPGDMSRNNLTTLSWNLFE